MARHLSQSLQGNDHMRLLNAREGRPASSAHSAKAEEKQLRESISVMEQNEVRMAQVYKDDM